MGRFELFEHILRRRYRFLDCQLVQPFTAALMAKGYEISSRKLAAITCSTAAIAMAMAPIQVAAQQASDGPTLQAKSKFFGYNLTAGVSTTATDNVLLSNANKQADLITSLSLGGGLLLNNSRLSAIIDGSLSVSAYLDPATDSNGNEFYDQFLVAQDVNGAATFKAVNNLLYLDVGAGLFQQPLGTNAAASTQENRVGNQSADAFSYNISPYIFHKFSNQGSVELRASYGDVRFDGSDANANDPDSLVVTNTDDNTDLEDFLNDSVTESAAFNYNSGRLLDRVKFAIDVSSSETEETGSNRLPELFFNQDTASLTSEITLGRRVAFVGVVGEDDIEIDRQLSESAIALIRAENALLPVADQLTEAEILSRIADINNAGLTDGDEVSGSYWKAGFIVRPGRRTFAKVLFGERFNGDLVEGELRYNLSNRLTVAGQINRRLQTGAQLSQGAISVTQSQSLSFIDDLRQLQNATSNEIVEQSLSIASGLNNQNSIDSGLSTSNSASLSAVATSGRTQYNAGITYNDSDFGFNQTESYGFNAGVQAQLSRRLSMSGTVNFTRNDSISNGTFEECVAFLTSSPGFVVQDIATREDAIATQCGGVANAENQSDEIRLNIGAQYLLGKDVSGFVNVSRRERSFEGTSLGGINGREYEENSIQLGVNFRF